MTENEEMMFENEALLKPQSPIRKMSRMLIIGSAIALGAVVSAVAFSTQYATPKTVTQLTESTFDWTLYVSRTFDI
jgi:hypothetical protein